ncbi:phosphatase PAP2 family protein [Amycolatopsis pittospori]|uniref:phosphatase PAP2 family protein n=1 Tax=Amycolatopsis pittospori TaxID=2749434 RepID=UPI0015F05C1D|nr:phosphatase PAP2 family protein [Amycolatopsis pittospori]
MKPGVLAAPPALPPVLRPTAFVLAVAGFLGALVLLLMYAGTSEATGIDAVLVDALAWSDDPWWTIAVVIDFVGEPLGSIVVMVLFLGACLYFRRLRTAIAGVVSVVLTVGLTSGLKPLTGRFIHGEFLSYPSGHTGFVTALTFTVALGFFGRLRAAWASTLLVFVVVLAGAAMGWAQVTMGAHYPTDTLGGFGVALAVVPVAALLTDKWSSRRTIP